MLGKNVAQVEFDGPRRNPQGLGDLLVAFAQQDLGDHIPFSVAELADRGHAYLMAALGRYPDGWVDDYPETPVQDDITNSIEIVVTDRR